MRWFSRAFGGSARGARDVDEALRFALLALLDRDLDQAEERLAVAVRLDPGGVDAYLALARLYRTRGEIGRAIRIHQNMLLRDDLPAETRLVVLADLAADFRQGGFLRRAIATYEEVITDDKRHQVALRSLVELLAHVGEFPRAIELARRLAKLEGEASGPAEARLYVSMAEAAQAAGDSDAARRAVKKALRRDSGCVTAWALRGALEAERGRSKAALAAWAEVPRRDPASGPLVYHELEATYAALGRTLEFESLIRGLLEQNPDDVAARRALAGWLAARGDVDTAVRELQLLLSEHPDDLSARAALGRILLAENRARELMQEYGTLIDALDRRGLLDEAEKLE